MSYQSTRNLVEAALTQVGLPVVCAYADCGQKGYVKPQSDYGGWYKSKMFRFKMHKRWFCPDHYKEGREIDNTFYRNLNTPDPYSESELEKTQDELYKLLD